MWHKRGTLGRIKLLNLVELNIENNKSKVQKKKKPKENAVKMWYLLGERNRGKLKSQKSDLIIIIKLTSSGIKTQILKD